MIKKTAIIGMGALGLLYADQLTSGLKDLGAVEFVMDPERAERHKADVYKINQEEKHFSIISCVDAQPADLVIVAVKYTSLPEAIRTMKNSVGENTIILSVMNGVTSEKIIAQEYGFDRMIYTVAQGMDAMRDGCSLRYTKCGALHIGGTDPEMLKRVDEVEDLFKRASLPYVREENILYRLWFKYMLNVGVNQTCMAFDTTYSVATTEGNLEYEKMVGAMREVVQVAAKKGITLTEADVQKCVDIERTLDPDGFPSMAQDRKAGRKSEVDMFAGEMIRMGKEYDIPTPYNQYFMDRVIEIEKTYA